MCMYHYLESLVGRLLLTFSHMWTLRLENLMLGQLMPVVTPFLQPP